MQEQSHPISHPLTLCHVVEKATRLRLLRGGLRSLFNRRNDRHQPSGKICDSVPAAPAPWSLKTPGLCHDPSRSATGPRSPTDTTLEKRSKRMAVGGKGERVGGRCLGGQRLQELPLAMAEMVQAFRVSSSEVAEIRRGSEDVFRLTRIPAPVFIVNLSQLSPVLGALQW